MLIKFLRDEHVESFLCGNLYFKNAGYFIDLESKLFEKGIGDKYEGSMFQPINEDNPICTFDKNGITHPLNLTEAFFTQRYDISRQFQLTCFTDIVIEDLEPEGDGVKIKSDVLSELEKEFSKRVPIIIIDETQFFDKISSAFKEMNIIPYRGNIKYFDEYTEATLNPLEYEHDIAQAFFYKRSLFKHQREYRIITGKPIPGDSLTVTLGNINDIVVRMNTISDLGRWKFQEIK